MVDPLRAGWRHRGDDERVRLRKTSLTLVVTLVCLLPLQVGAMFARPIAPQWVLGGFVQGSAIGLWSSASVLVALVAWGTRPATYIFAAPATPSRARSS